MLQFKGVKKMGVEGTGSSGPFNAKQKSIGEVIENIMFFETDQLDGAGKSGSLTKHSKLQCLRFDGNDFRRWLFKIEQFFEADQTKEEDKVRTVMMHLDGKALQWHQRFMKNQGPLTEVNWTHYTKEMRIRFSDNEFTDPMFEIISLRQTQSVEDYYEECESLLNLLQLPDDYALSIFISNLKPEISKPMRLFLPKNYYSRP